MKDEKAPSRGARVTTHDGETEQNYTTSEFVCHSVSERRQAS